VKKESGEGICPKVGSSSSLCAVSLLGTLRSISESKVNSNGANRW